MRINTTLQYTYSTMKPLVYLIVILLLCRASHSVRLAPLYWNSSNPIFKTGKTLPVIEVKLSDEVDFVCPFYHNRPTLPEYYIIHRVDEESYSKCRLRSKDKHQSMILNCSTPFTPKRYTILFETFNPIPNAPEFRAGQNYYFISTSTGNFKGLDNVNYGACHNFHMKLIFSVSSLKPSNTYFDYSPNHQFDYNPPVDYSSDIVDYPSNNPHNKHFNSRFKESFYKNSLNFQNLHSKPSHSLPFLHSKPVSTSPKKARYHSKGYNRNKQAFNIVHHNHSKPYKKSTLNKSTSYVKKRKKKLHHMPPRPEGLYGKSSLTQPSTITLIVTCTLFCILR